MEAKAILRTARISAAEGPPGRRPGARPVGRTRRQPAEVLATRRPPQMIYKVVESAIANAENNQGADVDELKVTTSWSTKVRS